MTNDLVPDGEAPFARNPDKWSQATMLPTLFRDDSQATINRALEYFHVSITNKSTRGNYQRAVVAFVRWMSERDATSIRHVQSLHVAEFIDERSTQISIPTVIGELAAVRGWLDYLTCGGHLPFNPASNVRGPRYSRVEGKTPGMTAEEATQLLSSIETDTLKGKRDRAIIGLMLYSGCRVGSVSAMTVADFYQSDAQYFMTLHENGNKVRTLVVHHVAAEYLHEWSTAACITDQPQSPLFRTMPKRVSLQERPFTDNPIVVQTMLQMVKTRCERAGLGRRFTNHSFRVTAITNMLDNGAPREEAQRLTGHVDARSIDLYDRRSRVVTSEIVERINYGRPAKIRNGGINP